MVDTIDRVRGWCGIAERVRPKRGCERDRTCGHSRDERSSSPLGIVLRQVVAGWRRSDSGEFSDQSPRVVGRLVLNGVSGVGHQRHCGTAPLLRGDTSDFLAQLPRCAQRLRHCVLQQLGGTVTRTLLEAVNRLGWILATLRSPVRFTSVAPRTVTEFVSCSFRDALALMRTHDFPQLPHHHDALGWILVT